MRLLLSDTPLDGATWLYANRVFEIRWRNPGGDWLDANWVKQGPAAFIRKDVVAPGLLTLDAKALVEKWLSDGNTGLLVRRVSGPAIDIASRRIADGPRLVVNGVACPCLACIWMDASTDQPLQRDTVQTPLAVRFDLSGVAAPVTSAVLTLRVSIVWAGAPLPVKLELSLLDMPELVTAPAEQGGVVVPGEAVAAEIFLRHDLTSEQYVKENLLAVLTGGRIASGGATFEQDPKGFTWCHCHGNTGMELIAAWHQFMQPRDALPSKYGGAAWRRPYTSGQALGYDRLHVKFKFKVGLNVRTALNELGMKLPGIAGEYIWSSSGATTLPPPPNDGTFQARLWHSKQSNAHPHLYRGATYWYGADHPFSQFSGIGQVRWFNKVNFCFEAGREYALEQGMVLNTITAGVPDKNGEYRVWVDGVLVHEQTGLYIRKYPHAQIQDFFVNLYHGGTTRFPLGPITYSLAEFEFSEKYIGVPAITPPPTEEPDMATPQTVLGFVTDAYNDALELAGQPSQAQQIAILQAEKAALQTKLTNALALVDAAIAADTVADQQEAQRLAAAKAALQ